MLKPYQSILAIKGAKSFTGAGLIARFPIAMYGLGIILLIQIRSGSYFQAGLAAASFTLAAALIQPITARWADQIGQSKVLPLQTFLHVVTLLMGIGAVLLAWPLPAVMVLFALSGASAPSIGALVRSRWVYVTKTPRQFHAALALESVADELIFVIGPVLVTVLVINVADIMGLVMAAVLVTAGVLMLTPQRATEPPPSSARVKRESHLLAVPAFRWIVVVSVFTGGVFGAFEVSTVAFAQENGYPELTGVFIASYAAGSLIAGLIVGALHLQGWIVSRFTALVLLLAVLAVPLPFLNSGLLVGLAVFVAGFSIAPVLITSYAVIERLLEDRRLTEGFTWFTSGLGVGLAGAAAISGAVIDDFGAAAGYGVLVACGAGAAGAVLLGFKSLASALPRVGDTSKAI